MNPIAPIFARPGPRRSDIMTEASLGPGIPWRRRDTMHKSRLPILAALALSLMVAVSVRAQQRIDNGDGHLLDANNRIRSGGSNGAVSPAGLGPMSPWAMQNNIVYGNVTNG